MLSDWLAVNASRELRAHPRVTRVRELLDQGSIALPEFHEELNRFFEHLASGEPGVDASGVTWDQFAAFGWAVCDVLQERQLLPARALWRRRMTVWLGFAHACVHYYRPLVQAEGARWANGLRRAEEFRALIADEQPDSKALETLVNTLERECHREGSFFYLMAGRVRATLATVREPAG